MLAVAVVTAMCGIFVSPDQAAGLAGAVVLDARGWLAYRGGHLPGAVRIDWKDYRDGWGRTGRLPTERPALEAMAGRLAHLGVRDDRPALIYGESSAGFGEEGRIAWMLTYLGHKDVHILDGGIAAWRAAGKGLERGGGAALPAGHLPVQVRPLVRAAQAEVKASLGGGAPRVLDVRSRAEWDGATPYFEARGGHIPGAAHLPWQGLFDEAGRVLPPARLRALVRDAIGADPAGAPLILYCTGGVRSAMAWAALCSAGLEVRNYDGSFWEWAADRRLPVVRSGEGGR